MTAPASASKPERMPRTCQTPAPQSRDSARTEKNNPARAIRRVLRDRPMRKKELIASLPDHSAQAIGRALQRMIDSGVVEMRGGSHKLHPALRTETAYINHMRERTANRAAQAQAAPATYPHAPITLQVGALLRQAF